MDNGNMKVGLVYYCRIEYAGVKYEARILSESLRRAETCFREMIWLSELVAPEIVVSLDIQTGMVIVDPAIKPFKEAFRR